MKSMLAATLFATLMLGIEGAEAESGAQIVQSQVVAYNRHDLDGFADTYADDIRIYRIRTATAEPLITGKAQLREFYRTERFNRRGSGFR